MTKQIVDKIMTDALAAADGAEPTDMRLYNAIRPGLSDWLVKALVADLDGVKTVDTAIRTMTCMLQAVVGCAEDANSKKWDHEELARIIAMSYLRAKRTRDEIDSHK